MVGWFDIGAIDGDGGLHGRRWRRRRCGRKLLLLLLLLLLLCGTRSQPGVRHGEWWTGPCCVDARSCKFFTRSVKARQDRTWSSSCINGEIRIFSVY
jgi:hypothetical protein